MTFYDNTELVDAVEAASTNLAESLVWAMTGNHLPPENELVALMTQAFQRSFVAIYMIAETD